MTKSSGGNNNLVGKNKDYSTPKKIFWVIFSLFTISIFIGLPFYVGKTLLESGSILSNFILIVIVVLPIVNLFGTFLFLPLLIENRIVVSFLALLGMIYTQIFISSVVPIKYIFPQISVLIAIYLISFFTFSSFIYNLGRLMSQSLKNWLISYNSPQSFSDLFKNTPQNIIASIKVDIIKLKAQLILLIFSVLTILLIIFFPSFLGLGVFELKKTFPNESLFQNSIQQRFFSKSLPTYYSIQSYTRNPSLSGCWMELPSDIRNNYWISKPVAQELTIVEAGSLEPLYISTIKTACDFDTETLSKEQKGDIVIYRLFDSYLNIQYPGRKIFLESEADRNYHTASEESLAFEMKSDKKKIWLRKEDSLLCTQMVNESNITSLISLLESFKTKSLDMSKCHPTVLNKSKLTPRKVVIILDWKLSKEEMQIILRELGTTSCDNHWEDSWSFLCIVPEGSEDKIVNQARENPNVYDASRWGGG